MGELVRRRDWSKTPLGPIERWSQSLRIAVNLALDSHFPMLVLWGPDLIQLYNDAYSPLLGRRHPGALGQPTSECWPELWRTNEPIYERVRWGEVVYLEDEPCPAGARSPEEPMYATICYSPLRDEQGTIAGVIVTLVDTTERVLGRSGHKRVEEERAAALTREREANALLDAIFASAPIGLGFWDRELRFQRLNTRLAEINGLPAEDHIGRRPDELLPGLNGLEDVMRGWREIIATGKPWLNVEVHGSTPADSSPHTWLESFFPVCVAGETIGLGGVIEDITERTRAEATLREHAQRLYFLSEAASALLATDRPSEFLERICEQLSALLGLEIYIQYELVPAGTHLELVASRGITAQQQQALHRLNFGQALCGTVAESRQPMIVEDVQSSTDERTALVRSLGLTRYICHPLLAHGALVGTLSFGARSGTTFDANAISLIRTVCDQVATAIVRARAEQALRDADRRKDEFLATLAHELRNPLAPVRTGLQIMKVSAAANDPLRRTSEIMERQVNHLVRLVDDLLDVSRITQGKIELRRQPVSLHEAVSAAVDSAREPVQKKALELQIWLSEQPLMVEGDIDRLVQVFANLLSNATKYTNAGGRIWLRAWRDGDEAVVSVKDSGIGIAPDAIRGVFEMFSQAAPGKRGEGGLGIGLALVRQLVELHGGAVQALSAGAGQGSEFIVRLPLLEQATGDARADAEPEMSEIPGAQRRVLVVDDNEDVAESMAALLKTIGHDVRQAHDGVAALEIVTEFEPEIVLMDIGMPRMDGLEAARRIRQLELRAQPVIVALTGWGQDTNRQRSRESGIDHHLVKPVELEALQPLLQKVHVRPPPPHAANVPLEHL